ncbi:primosomal protein DnaT [Enterobacter sp. ECC-175]|uniref:primosomal protein DnaT n=1 Tax=unclassified Enterobacter TaxID=2608935 RepID=UPI000D4BDCFF|nr:primosomal protein DnaT [Enterobacter sp. RIT 418]RAU36163.1 primosomal protein DnaT [Enterobacter sp. RIT 418]
MSSRILTSSIAGIDAFMRDPRGMLTHAEKGTLAVFADNAPAFYAITPERLAQLLETEARLSRPPSDVSLDTQFFEEPASGPVAVPMGKFAMYAGWQPDADFLRLAALWGIALSQPVTPEELAAFTAYWQAEGKVFHHIQWQQKLARSIQINRASNNGQPKRDINAFSEPDKQIPNGFRGAK